ncbi:hypothetical protein H5T51_05100, partial [Candidatus Bathyarchaeota archaeon]|nr:hypothetical protein [Candidatus Bathyarchaeota archaeon]
MSELGFITELIEERLVRGRLRWLANFNEIRKDYQIGNFIFPLYAAGGLGEKGFFLSRIFSHFVTPKYKVHFLIYKAQNMDTKSLRSLILACKQKFSENDWILIGLLQTSPFDKSLEKAIENIADKRVGVAAFSLASNKEVCSENVLGKALQKQLRLGDASFESFDIINYVKSVAMIFILSILMLAATAIIGNIPQAVQPLTLLILVLISLIIGHQIYKSRYHVT